MRTVIAVQARLNSQRMPRKILMDVGGKPLLTQVWRRCAAVSNADLAVVACPHDDKADIEAATGLVTVAGPEKDLLTRLLMVAHEYNADKLVRVTADCPLIPPDMIRHLIEQSIKYPGYDVVQNWKPRCHPDGFDCEVWDVDYLSALSIELEDEGDREWFAQYALEHGAKQMHIDCGEANYSDVRLTVDYPEDLEVVRALYAEMGSEVWGSELVVRWCIRNPRVMRKNLKYTGHFGARPKDVPES